jgi:hypothetical protein
VRSGGQGGQYADSTGRLLKGTTSITLLTSGLLHLQDGLLDGVVNLVPKQVG